MSFLTHPEAVGFVGVTLLLIAFFLNLFRLLKAESNAYLALNLIGASLACAEPQDTRNHDEKGGETLPSKRPSCH